MSVAGLSTADTGKVYKKSVHRRNDSDELDVFEAARYFSGYNEAASAAGSGCYNNGGATYTQKVMREDHKHSWRGGRMSLDVPMRNPILPHNQYHHNQYQQQSHHLTVEKQTLKDQKKHKQPSSPGGRLASFLNSLFSQTSSKKKKSKSTTTTQSMKDIDDESSPGWRRKRRSSISHFRSSSSTTNAHSKSSLYSSSSSGFRTPPPCSHTPTKGYKELRSYSSDQKQQTNGAANAKKKSTTAFENEIIFDDKKNSTTTTTADLSRLDDHDQKFKFNGQYGLSKNRGNRTWVDKYPSEEKESSKFNEEDDDDGGESDSSSDLFELTNYDLGIYSSGLPVYETTNMDSIRRSATTPISIGNL